MRRRAMTACKKAYSILKRRKPKYSLSTVTTTGIVVVVGFGGPSIPAAMTP